MARRYTQRRIYQHAQAEVRSEVERSLLQLGLEIKPTDSEWLIEASRSVTSITWGERVSVRMATFPGGGTQVIAESRLVLGFVDWGRNEQNVTELFGLMEPALGSGEIAPVDS